MKRRGNPVRELDIDPAELKRLEKEINRQFGGRGATLRQAAHLYTQFTGHKDVDISKVKVLDMPSVLTEIGVVDGILYTTVRDGQTERYIHRFKASSKPVFAVSPDGLQLFLLGGRFKFGSRGIVDKP